LIATVALLLWHTLQQTTPTREPGLPQGVPALPAKSNSPR
jgi:hypothetical protein